MGKVWYNFKGKGVVGVFDYEQFFIHVRDDEKNLHITREKPRKSDALSRCDMDADDVDYEMQFPKNKEMIRICGASQEGFEHFCRKYGRTYRHISLFKCQLISDLSPLGELPNLEYVDIYWNIRSDKLWDMSRNVSLRALHISDCKKMTYDPRLLATAPVLEDVSFTGVAFGTYPMKSLEVFAQIPTLRNLALRRIKPEDKTAYFLDTAKELETYEFDPGMYTTEEIARMVARRPDVGGNFFRAYGQAYPGSRSYFRVSGYRKPELELPRQQKALDKHAAYFNALVEQYRREEGLPVD